MAQLKSKTILTDAEKNRQAILNRQLMGKQQGGVKLTNDPKVVSVNANTATGRKLTSITQSQSAIANQAAQKAGPATNEIIQQYDTVNGNKGDVVSTTPTTTGQTTTPTTSTASSDQIDTSNQYGQELINMGFSTGSLSTIQQIINNMSEDTAEQRIQKKKAQEALSNYSSSGAGSVFVNPNLETSSEQILNDIEKAQADLFADYSEEKTALEQQIEGMRSIEESQFNQSKAQADRARAGATAAFAQGQEGVVSTTAPLISKQFSETLSTQLNNSRTRLDLAQAQRDKMVRDLDQAYKDGNQELADSISENLAIAGSNIQKIQQEAANAAAEANANALDFLKTDTTGMFAGMNPVDLANSMGIDIGTAGFMIRASEQKWNIAMGEAEMSQIDKAYKIAQIDKMVEDAKWAGMTEDTKKFSFYTQLLKTNPEIAQAYAIKNGFADDPNSIEQQRFELEKLKAAQDGYNLTGGDSGGVWVPPNSAYQCWAGTDGTFNVEVNTGEIPPNGRGQCGEFTNDVLFGSSGFFGDSLKSKKTYINNGMSPVVGGAFIMDTGDSIGHVGIVTKVYEDGSIDIIDSNRHSKTNPLAVDTGHIENPSESGIVGYFNPSKSAGNWNPPDSLNSNTKLLNRLSAVSADYAKDSKEVRKMVNTGDYAGAEALVKNKESVVYFDKIQKLESGDFTKFLSDYNNVKMSADKINKVKELGTSDPQAMALADSAIIMLLQKSLDPGSVVREGEYDRVAATLSIPGQVQAKIKKAIEGGAGIDDKTREAALSIASKIAETYESYLNTNLTNIKKRASMIGVPEDFADEYYNTFIQGENMSTDSSLDYLWNESGTSQNVTWDQLLPQ